MKIHCPKCRAAVEVDDAAVGGEAACSACGATLRIRPKSQPTSRCPSCREPVAASAVICVNCGFNLKKGVRVHTATDLNEPRPQEEEAPPSAPMRGIQFLAEYVPGAFRPLLLVLSIITAILGLGILVFGLALFAAGVLISAFAVGAAGVIVYAHGVAWLIDGHFGFLSEALVDFDGPRWGLFAVLMIIPLLSLWLLTKTLLAP